MTDRIKRIKALEYDYDKQEKEHFQHCNICKSEKLYQLTHTDRYSYNASISACTNCGLTFLNPRMTSKAYMDFYAAIYRPLVSAYHGRLIDKKTVQEDQKQYTQNIIKWLRPFLENKPYKTLLDVGGSTGIVAAGLKKAYNIEATLIDPAPDEVEEAKALGVESIVSFIEDWAPGGRKFDIIGMFQTIDHLLDAKGTFEKLRQVINKDGLLMADIVDFRNAYLRHWNITEATKIDHPYYFTEDNVETLFRRTGFEPIKKIVHPDHLHILYICKPVTPDTSYLPAVMDIQEYLKEIRFVQSTPWKKK